MSSDPTDSPLTDAEQQLARSQQQFGANAGNYVRSTPHAKGASLGRLVELAQPQSHWQALDIASAAGHTAWAFAPHVSDVVVSDATPEMLDAARGVAADRGIDNVRFEQADAHDLPFDDESFDLVTCRIAPHHFSDPATFVTESARVLRPGGTFGLVDNIAPEDPETATFCDDFERRRDLSHRRCLPLSEWETLIKRAGLTLRAVETMTKSMNFDGWANNMSVDAATRLELLDDLRTASPLATEWLMPTIDPDGDQTACAFILTEGILLATKA